MPRNKDHKHHYVPQFYLRNFAIDEEKKKIATVGKHGSRAIWSIRSIKGLGWEHDLYVHLRRGVPVSVESVINDQIEIPISQSDTWAKIVSNKTDTLDRSDKPILYALIKHLETRSPHYRATAMELAQLAADPDSEIPFTEEERELYAYLRTNKNSTKEFFNLKASSLEWSEQDYSKASVMVFRSPIPLRSSSVPVLTMNVPEHPALHLPLPGTKPYQLVLPLNPTTIVCLVIADFDDNFINAEISLDEALGFNRQYVCQFSNFDQVRHLITGREDIEAEMAWAQYQLIEENKRSITFRKRN